MESKYFLSPRLTGTRFDGHSVPVEILEDFVALEELILELAKHIYLEENPTRKRVPKGFTEGVSLNLDKIEDGSAILNFFLTTSLLASSILGENSHSYTYFEKAKNKVIEVIDTADKGDDVKKIISERYLNYFNRIGRGLKEDENIFFSSKTTKDSSKLNKSIRKKIILSVGEDSTYKDKFAITALITSIDKANKTFTLQVDNQKISANLDQKFYRTIMNTFNEYDSNTHVSIQGEGIYSSNDKLVKINLIDKMDILDPLDVSFRLSELSKLKDGWYNSEGMALNKKGLINFENLFEEHFNETLPLPAIFPTVEGNIQLEWTINTKEISLEINLKDLTAELISVDISSSDVFEADLDLNESISWDKFTQYLAD